MVLTILMLIGALGGHAISGYRVMDHIHISLKLVMYNTVHVNEFMHPKYDMHCPCTVKSHLAPLPDETPPLLCEKWLLKRPSK